MDLTALTLFGRARYQVLACLFALRKGEAIHLREIARRAGLSPAATQYELRLLTQAGIVLQASSGRSILYRVNAAHAIARELRAIIEKTDAGKQAPVIEDAGPWIRKRFQQKADYASRRAGRQSRSLADRASAPFFEVDFRVDGKAIAACRAHLEKLLSLKDERQAIRAATRMLEIAGTAPGLQAFRKHGLDLLDGIPIARFRSRAFKEQQYKRTVARIKFLREAYRPPPPAS